MIRMVKVCPKCLQKNPAASDDCSRCGESIIFVNAEEEQPEATAARPAPLNAVGKYRKCRECGHKNFVEDENEYLSHCKNPECKNPDIMKEPVEVEDTGREVTHESALCLVYRKPVKRPGPSREGETSDNQAVYEIRVPQEGAVLGKEGDLDAEFFKRFKYISSYHCRVYQKGGNWYVKDLGSRNGTYVHGSREPLEPYKECIIREGKVLRLADLELLITRGKPHAD